MRERQVSIHDTFCFKGTVSNERAIVRTNYYNAAVYYYKYRSILSVDL
jgi:hypothetical protein